jgi:hypothetical protein
LPTCVHASSAAGTLVGLLASGSGGGRAARAAAPPDSARSKVVRLRHVGPDLESIQKQRELPPRIHARYPLRPMQVHVPAARVGRMQDRQGDDPGIRYLRRVRPSPQRRRLTKTLNCCLLPYHRLPSVRWHRHDATKQPLHTEWGPTVSRIVETRAAGLQDGVNEARDHGKYQRVDRDIHLDGH